MYVSYGTPHRNPPNLMETLMEISSEKLREGWMDGAVPFISSKSNLMDPRTLHDTTLNMNTALCDPSLPDKHDRLVRLSQSRQMKKKAGRGQNRRTSVMLQQRGTEKASCIFQMFFQGVVFTLFNLFFFYQHVHYNHKFFF